MRLPRLGDGPVQARAGLEYMFRPSVIAVVGASRDPAKWGRRILEYTGRAGFSGTLYGVNPGVADLNVPRVTTVAALSDIGQPIDLAVLARPASTTAELMDECAALARVSNDHGLVTPGRSRV